MKSKTLIVMTLLLLSVSYAQAQRRNTPRVSKVTKQMATTDEGRKVELNSNGTWKYADSSSEIDVERPTPKAKTFQSEGILFKLQQCQSDVSRLIVCDFEATVQQNKDIRLSLDGYRSSYNDNFGNQVGGAKSVTLANVGSDINLVSKVPVKGKISFSIADTAATKISKLVIAIETSGAAGTSYVEFRDIPLQR